MAKIALLVGVSQCRSGFKPLPAAARDVEALQAVLKDPERGGFEVVQVLVDPEFYALRRAISNLFTNRAEDDLLLFYFSGHGIADEYGQFYFTAADTQDGDNGRTDLATTLESRFVHQVMGRCDSERQVVILDCCHSGAFPEGMLARGAETIDFAQQLGGRGRVVLASSAAMDYSFEREGEELAIYTRYLVEGLSTGAADLDEDGQISADELHEYVKRKVQKAAPSMLPERYVFQDGEKILLAKAVMADPERRYRKCVEQYSEQGVILPTGRRILRITCRNLRLSESVAERIEAEVLQPYREYQESLLEYGEVLRELLGLHNPLTTRAERELEDLRKELKLRSEDVGQVRAKAGIKPSSPSPAPKPTAPKPTSERSSGGANKTPGVSKTPGVWAEDLGQGIKLEMVGIPGGEFLMGSPKYEAGRTEDEGPQHRVRVPEFFLGKYAVTQAQWKQVAALPKQQRELNPDPAHFKGANRPVEQVSWDEAQEFCARLSQASVQTYRLPSEAEWEYACRAGTTTPFSFGETISTDLANYRGQDWKIGDTIYPGKYGSGQLGSFREETTDVGSFPANAFDLYDMHGNVWEWCEDEWHESYKGAPTDGSAWKNSNKSNELYRLLRGGSWYLNPRRCRSAFRLRYHRGSANRRTGFRVACRALPRT